MSAQPSKHLTGLGAQPIAEHMSRSPACIASHRTLGDAWSMMQHERVRHLPVLEGGVVVGMISQRDLALLETKSPLLLSEVRIEDAMSGEPYVVAPTAPLRAVVTTMLTRKIGAAIVADAGKVTGVFTTTDALTLLRRMLDASAGGS